MGNQEAKQKRAAAASTNESYPSIDEEWKEGGGDVTKRRGKKLGKHGGRGPVSGGEGGGSHGTGPSKKKNKSDSKTSVFSLRKRKGNLKGKRETCSSVTGSKEDILALQNNEPYSSKMPDLSGDDMGQSDTEAAFLNKNNKLELGNRDGDRWRGQKQWLKLKTSMQATSPTEEGEQKGGSSGSDTDIYSFHSAADQEDLLTDIQLTIKLQHQQHGGIISVLEAHGEGEGDLSWGEATEVRIKQSNGITTLNSSEVQDLTPELELGSDALSFLDRGTLLDSVKPTDLPLVFPSTQTPFSFHTEVQRQVGIQEEVGMGKGVVEGSLCIAMDTKDQQVLLQQSPFIEISMNNAEEIADSHNRITMETSSNSLSEIMFYNPEGKEERGRETLLEDEIDLSPAVPISICNFKPAEVLSTRMFFKEFRSQLDSDTSAESLNDCLSAGSETNSTAAAYTRAPISVQHCRRSSTCFTAQPPPQESPNSPKQLHRSIHSSCSSNNAVKPYPPIFASYIKTTTRQLTSSGHFPGLSPSQSPLSSRRTHSYFYRYVCVEACKMSVSTFLILLNVLHLGSLF